MLSGNGRIQDPTVRCVYGHSYTAERPSQTGGSRHRSFLSMTMKHSMHFDSETLEPSYMGEKNNIKTTPAKFIASFDV